MTDGPFDAYRTKAWPYHFHLELIVAELHGGTPRNPDVVRSWLRAKAGYSDEVELEAEVARIFAADPTKADNDVATEAASPLADRYVNGFKRDELGCILEGRQLKACIKEACSVARATNKLPARFGTTNKGTLAFVAEHVVVPDRVIHLGRQEHDALHTRFVSTWRGNGITVEEVIYDAKVSATVLTDHPFTEEQWAMVWLTAEQQGIGASRSQGFGTFTVTDWHRID